VGPPGFFALALARTSVRNARLRGGGGNWEVVEEIVRETLCQAGVEVTVYDLEAP
jgi:hypothetical protein